MVRDTCAKSEGLREYRKEPYITHVAHTRDIGFAPFCQNPERTEYFKLAHGRLSMHTGAYC